MGKECSGYFPAGSAQYHISGDIAYSIVSYYLVTKNLDFIAEKGAEIVFETDRMIKAIERSFAYYEKVTTHNSSLSTCIYSIVWLIYEGSRILVKVNRRECILTLENGRPNGLDVPQAEAFVNEAMDMGALVRSSSG